jgi:hypothetical protein
MAHSPSAGRSAGGAGAEASFIGRGREGGTRWRLRTRWLVNAAGLHAQRVAASLAGVPRASIPRLYLAKASLGRPIASSRLLRPLVSFS